MEVNLSRRRFLACIGIGAAAFSLPLRAAAKRANVLFLFTDDQRFNTLGALNNPAVRTPHLDRLVREGVCFRNAYIMGGNSGAICMPSRAMLLTGRTVFSLSGRGETIPSEHVMFPELMRRRGYQTFGIGKWHNGPEAFNRCFEDGAEIMFGGMGDHWNVRANDYDPSGSYDNVRPYIRDPYVTNRTHYSHVDHITPGVHSSELFADAAIDFLNRRDRGRPFLVYVSFMAPHDPRSMPAEFREMYDPETVELPPNYAPQHPFDNGEMKVRDELLEAFPREPGAVRRHIAEYYAMITHLDAQIGRILATLEQGGELENTLIVFAGDNGLAVGQHGLMGKQNLYEHSVHVPLVFRGPAIPAGASRGAFCYLLDIYPTLTDLLDLPVPESVQGVSLARVITGEKSGHRDAVVFAYKNLMRGLRRGDWKLIVYNVAGNKTTQLFDLARDPWETMDLASDPQQRPRIESLGSELERLLAEAGEPFRLADVAWGFGAAGP